jgi:hypothetical protein
VSQIDLTRSRVGKPMDRCCESHPDWPTLTQHLIDAFPAVALEDIVRAVAEAKTATDGMDLGGEDALLTGEVLARQQLRERSGSQASGSAPTP